MKDEAVGCGLWAVGQNPESRPEDLPPTHSPQPTAHSLPIVHVIAGALLDGQGRVLIAQRPAGKHLAGGWEFPGGKLQSLEKPLDGLRRELMEELGVTIRQADRLASCQHDYSDRRVLLELWTVTAFDGEPQSLDGQALRWVQLSDLNSAGLLPADKPLVTALLDKYRRGGFETRLLNQDDEAGRV